MVVGIVLNAHLRPTHVATIHFKELGLPPIVYIYLYEQGRDRAIPRYFWLANHIRLLRRAWAGATGLRDREVCPRRGPTV